jgi:secondary thiamine-phosphate synthase enzyme
MVKTEHINVSARENCDILDITSQLAEAVRGSGFKDGTVTVFCPGSTGGLTTIEFESGVITDLEQVFEDLAPVDGDYRHHLRWGDDNGSAHVRAALVGPSITVPFVHGDLTLGTWQQVVFINFDTRPRTRRLVVQMIGE